MEIHIDFTDYLVKTTQQKHAYSYDKQDNIDQFNKMDLCFEKINTNMQTVISELNPRLDSDEEIIISRHTFTNKT